MRTPQTLSFTKMHGLGNDFVVIDATQQSFEPHLFPMTQLSHRHLGIGFDQLLIIELSNHADFFCRIFNADGKEAEQCGNGLRCVARFLHETGMLSQKTFQLETNAGIFPIVINDYDHIQVTIGVPHIQEKLIDLNLKKNSLPTTVLSVGNPHAIIKVDSIENTYTPAIGLEISTHTLFPQGANVGFMQVLSNNHILLRTFERGVGETCACGSNAAAAACAGIINGWLNHHRINVQCRFGNLEIEWEGDDKPIQLIGPAAKVYEGILSY